MDPTDPYLDPDPKHWFCVYLPPQALVCPSDFNRKNDKMVVPSPDSSKASPVKGRSGKGGSGLVARTAALRLEVRNTPQVFNVKNLLGVICFKNVPFSEHLPSKFGKIFNIMVT
jgi:hypothetical protein